MQRIDIHSDHLQRQLVSLIRLSADFHLDGWQRIEVFVEAGDGEAATMGHLAVVGLGRVAFDGEQLHARHEIGARFPVGERHLRALVGCHAHGHVRLLTNEDGHGVYRLLHLHRLRLHLGKSDGQKPYYNRNFLQCQIVKLSNC